MRNRPIGHKIQSGQSGNWPIGQSGKCLNRAIEGVSQSLNRSLAAIFQSGTQELLKPIGSIGHELCSSAGATLLLDHHTIFSACRSSLACCGPGNRLWSPVWTGTILVGISAQASRCVQPHGVWPMVISRANARPCRYLDSLQ